MFEIGPEQAAQFEEDGFLIVENLIDPEVARAAAGRFEALFRGDFETGLQPDEWNWRDGRDSPELTRQICNGWKSDRAVAAVVLREDLGRACAKLMDWPGARLNQDNVIWKPPGAKALGFHQDNSYQDWIVPASMMTCWIALDGTTAAGGTLEYVRGSHNWPLSPMIRQFHGPEDPQEDLRRAAAEVGETPEIVAVEVPAGGGAFHHGGTWHGSGVNRGDRPRRSLVAHCMPAAARFHPSNTGPIYGRYKRFGSDEMEESYFPVLWTAEGGRSDFLTEYLAG